MPSMLRRRRSILAWRRRSVGLLVLRRRSPVLLRRRLSVGRLWWGILAWRGRGRLVITSLLRGRMLAVLPLLGRRILPMRRRVLALLLRRILALLRRGILAIALGRRWLAVGLAISLIRHIAVVDSAASFCDGSATVVTS